MNLKKKSLHTCMAANEIKAMNGEYLKVDDKYIVLKIDGLYYIFYPPGKMILTEKEESQYLDFYTRVINGENEPI